MDTHYKNWTSKRKKAGKIKIRHLCKVENVNLTHLHSIIARDFPLSVNSRVYSYRKNLTCSDCAAEHVGAFSLYKLDISDFFYSITRRMIQDMYMTELMYVIDKIPKCSKNKELVIGPLKIDEVKAFVTEVSYDIATLVTRSDPRRINLEDAVLPIGTIPASNISNHALMKVDRTLNQISVEEDIVYNRYSDNMFFSHKTEHISREFQEKVKGVVEDFEVLGRKPYKINKDKTAYSARWRQQRVLGIVVNTKLNISRGKEKYLRSALNHLYYEFQELYSAIENRSQRRDTLQNCYNKLHRRSDKIFGQLAHVYQVSHEKYKRYATWQHSIKLLRDETSLMLLEWMPVSKKNVEEGSPQ
jgi:hypothetical protein